MAKADKATDVVESVEESTVEPVEVPVEVPVEEDPRRPVKIKLFRDNYRYKDPVYVSIGTEYSALIRRGEEVTVPYFVAKHLEEMMSQDEKTAGMIQGLVEDYEKKREAYGDK